jgi:hypothetical protein
MQRSARVLPAQSAFDRARRQSYISLSSICLNAFLHFLLSMQLLQQMTDIPDTVPAITAVIAESVIILDLIPVSIFRFLPVFAVIILCPKRPRYAVLRVKTAKCI